MFEWPRYEVTSLGDFSLWSKNFLCEVAEVLISFGSFLDQARKEQEMSVLALVLSGSVMSALELILVFNEEALWVEAAISAQKSLSLFLRVFVRRQKTGDYRFPRVKTRGYSYSASTRLF